MISPTRASISPNKPCRRRPTVYAPSPLHFRAQLKGSKITTMNITKWDRADKYAAQSDIVKQALTTPEHSLDELLRLMRHTGQVAVYFSGTRLDSDYCFGSTDVGVLFSVLPQDAHAPTPGYHPGSAEVYVTFQGSLVMECLEEGQVKDKIVGANGVLVLPPGQCHRVRYDTRKAASIIVKTSLNAKPSVVRCETCTYYRDRTSCPLHQRWTTEVRP
jgi:mannose-6-phosphate isomerase-like protein (cupin superfamily)